MITSSDAPAEPKTLSDGTQTVIIAGDCRPELGGTIADLAAKAAVPLFAEPSSNARRGEAALSTYRLLLSSALADGDRAGRGVWPADPVPAGQHGCSLATTSSSWWFPRTRTGSILDAPPPW